MLLLVCWAFGVLAAMEVLSYMGLAKWKFTMLCLLWPLVALFVLGYVGYRLAKLEVEIWKEDHECNES